MKFIAGFATLLAFSGLASASPSYRRQAASPDVVTTDEPKESTTVPTATQVLQYALTLEHLENEFYAEFLGQFSEQDFLDAGFEPWVRGRVAQIGEHEAAHVDFLTTALGNESVAACNYSFPVTDVASFMAVSQILEGVGVTAYLGAAHFLTDETLTAAGSILTTEARHAGWISSAVHKQQPWSGAFDVALDMNQVFSLASPFITSCPASNPPLPVSAFPPLTLTTESVVPGSVATLAFKETSAAASPFLAILSGPDTTFVPLTSVSMGAAGTVATAQIPAGLQGTVFAVVTSDKTAVTDDNTIAGPIVLDFPFDSSASNA